MVIQIKEMLSAGFGSCCLSLTNMYQSVAVIDSPSNNSRDIIYRYLNS